ncbi:hypothetical protein [Virgibacillus sp. CBA3643]|uniref:hypothetical protein n=1 Tax=Virgibacillus sp. CBA3643 TaxID=2942278 RepID=UPI0035A268C1
MAKTRAEDKIFAVYRGDNHLFFGNVKEISKRLEVSYSMAKFYTTKTYKERTKKAREGYANRVFLVDVTDVI